MSDTQGTALITGGAVRLGRAIALALAEADYDIALHYHASAQAAETTAAEIRALGRRCSLFQLDLNDAQAFPAFIDDVRATCPDLSVLVNSASGYTQATISDTSIADFDEQIALNLRTPFFLTQAFAKRVTNGVVVNVLDNKIHFNQPNYAAYLLSKQALADFNRMAALEFAPGLRVNGVAPGVVLPASSRSEEYIAWRVAGIPLQRQGETRHVTAAILHLIENDFITGQVLTVDGGESLTNSGQNAGNYDPDKV